MRERRKERLSPGRKAALVLAVLIVLGGIGALAYPAVSQWWNARDQSEVVAEYAEEISGLDDKDRDEELRRAREHNRTLTDAAALTDPFSSDGSVAADYNTLLWATQEGVMAYVEIPKIGVLLPIYHGVSRDVLYKGIGHLPETSLPVGGESTHCVLAGHSGMNHARLFTDLPKLEIGDEFHIYVYDETLTYTVDQIKPVLPTDTRDLTIVDGKDYVTLLTCVPIGVNSHRLLVRGVRTFTAGTEQVFSPAGRYATRVRCEAGGPPL